MLSEGPVDSLCAAELGSPPRYPIFFFGLVAETA